MSCMSCFTPSMWPNHSILCIWITSWNIVGGTPLAGLSSVFFNASKWRHRKHRFEIKKYVSRLRIVQTKNNCITRTISPGLKISNHVGDLRSSAHAPKWQNNNSSKCNSSRSPAIYLKKLKNKQQIKLANRKYATTPLMNGVLSIFPFGTPFRSLRAIHTTDYT